MKNVVLHDKTSYTVPLLLMAALQVVTALLMGSASGSSRPMLSGEVMALLGC